jgi:hypothetical protein
VRLPPIPIASCASLSSPSWSAQRRRGRPLFARTLVPANEPPGVVGKIVVGVERPVEHLADDVLGYVSGPALGRIEGATTRSAFEYCPLTKLRMTASRSVSAAHVST